jgi:peptidoglycan-associated lipoprotein
MYAKICSVLFTGLLMVSLVCCSSFGSQKTAQDPAGKLPPVSRLEPVPSQSAQQMIRGPETQKPMMESVFFATGKHNITDQSAEVLKQEAEWLKENPQTKIQISGNTDQRGGAEYNQKLAMKRAEAVKNQLANLGVDPDRITTTSYGKERPMCQDATTNCYATNRRVDLQAIG